MNVHSGPDEQIDFGPTDADTLTSTTQTVPANYSSSNGFLLGTPDILAENGYHDQIIDSRLSVDASSQVPSTNLALTSTFEDVSSVDIANTDWTTVPNDFFGPLDYPKIVGSRDVCRGYLGDSWTAAPYLSSSHAIDGFTFDSSEPLSQDQVIDRLGGLFPLTGTGPFDTSSPLQASMTVLQEIPAPDVTNLDAIQVQNDAPAIAQAAIVPYSQDASRTVPEGPLRRRSRIATGQLLAVDQPLPRIASHAPS